MKIIFDFDDVIFNTKRYKTKKLFPLLVKHGVSALVFKKSYEMRRSQESIYDLKLHLDELKRKHKLPVTTPSLFKEATSELATFLHKNILSYIKTLTPKDVGIITKGEETFQRAKLKGSGILKHVGGVTITEKGKQPLLRAYCKKHTKEVVMYVDNLHENFITSNVPKNLIQIELLPRKDSTKKENIHYKSLTMQALPSFLARMQKEGVQK